VTWRRLVADGGSGEIMRLGGYMCIRPQPKAEEKHGCGAHRGEKRRRRFGTMASDGGGGAGGRWGSRWGSAAVRGLREQ
jgi:hypothetical protein